MPCPHEGSALLLVPLQDLCHLHIASAISLAEHMGEHAAQENLHNVLGERSKEVFADGDDYWSYVIMPAQERGEVGEEDFERWDKLFQSRTMMRDPRVQAFCASWSRTASELSVLAAVRMEMLTDQIPLLDQHEGRIGGSEELGLHEVSPNLQPVFARGDDRFLIFKNDEAKALAEESVLSLLHESPPEVLFEFSVLPDGAEDILEELQSFGPDANEALASLLDNFEEFADTAIQEMGYGPLLAPWLKDNDDAQVIQTGESLIIRWKASF